MERRGIIRTLVREKRERNRKRGGITIIMTISEEGERERGARGARKGEVPQERRLVRTNIGQVIYLVETILWIIRRNKGKTLS